MNKKPSRGFAVFTAFIVLAAVLSVVLRVWLTEKNGRRAAEANFEGLTSILSSVRERNDLADQVLRIRLQAHYQRSPHLLFASVYEKNAGQRWRIPVRSAYFPAEDDVSLRPLPSYPPRSALLLSTTLPGDSSGRLILDALYVVLPQSVVFAAFRDAALGLGAYLVLSIFLFLIAFGSTAKKETEETWTVGGPAAPEAPLPKDQDKGGPSEEELIYGDVDEEFEIPAIADSAPVPPPTAEVAEAVELEEPEIPEDERLEAPAQKDKEIRAGEPQGLFSPLSGLGWESYLLDRLEAELARSASFEQDLTLLTLLYEDLTPESPVYALITKAIVEFFSFKDLSFEHGSEGFVVILPNIDAEHGLRMAEEFLKKTTFLLKSGEHSQPLEYLPLFIGLSSRSGRLVEGSRLLREAESALAKAREERDSHIVAFRPDPDKYRLFLASRGC